MIPAEHMFDDPPEGDEWTQALTSRGRALLDFLDACELGGCTEDEIDNAAERWMDRFKNVEFP